MGQRSGLMDLCVATVDAEKSKAMQHLVTPPAPLVLPHPLSFPGRGGAGEASLGQHKNVC